MIYDFDRTLSISEMQDSFIRSLGMDPDAFWKKTQNFADENMMDPILAYMYVMKDESMKKNLPFNRTILRKFGSSIEFFNGLDTWFDSIGAVASEHNAVIEHYIISSGLKEIIDGTSIAKKFKRIYACEYYYDVNDNPSWVKNVVNFTSKTQFLFRINKGALDISDNKKINEFSKHEDRPIPFENMIYIGDGITDIPCMKLVKQNGGNSIGVYDSKKDVVTKLMRDDRINHYCKADYSNGSEIFE